MYLSVQPTDLRCPNDFYLRPMAAPRNNVWYSCQHMGRGKLSKVTASMPQAAKLDGMVTNHSLRATAASRLYQSNCDEQLVERTGHRVLLVYYKRTSSGQLEISSVLYGNGSKNVPVSAPVPINPNVFNNASATVSKPQVDVSNESVTGVRRMKVSLVMLLVLVVLVTKRYVSISQLTPLNKRELAES